MVIDVTNRNMSLDEIFHQTNLAVQESIHEMEMNLMIDKYNYLQENGVVMEGTTEKKSIFRHIADFFVMIGKAIAKACKAIVAKVKELIGKIKGAKGTPVAKQKALGQCTTAIKQLEAAADTAMEQVEAAQEDIKAKLETTETVDETEVMEEAKAIAAKITEKQQDTNASIAETVAKAAKDAEVAPQYMKGWTVTEKNGKVILHKGL